MKLTFLTPGTGSYYCGVCMRDNALVGAFKRQGHQSLMLPMYLPSYLDEPETSEDLPVFFGGINSYLQDRYPIFRRTPRWFDKLLDNRWLLRQVSKRSHMTEAAEHGRMTVSMFKGEHGTQAKELDKLVDWLQKDGAPDVLFLSTALQLGLARRLREALRKPIVCFLQGEDSFLDSLPEPFRSESWDLLAETAGFADLIVAPSRYFADHMIAKGKLDPSRVEVLFNGMNLDDFRRDKSVEAYRSRTILYLSRMMPGKGLHTLVDAFIELDQRQPDLHAKLIIAGAQLEGDAAYVEEQLTKLREAGLFERVQLRPNISREEKIDRLYEAAVLSVPANYGEAFGLYIIEAMAAGTPVVQPEHGAFPEIVEKTGGGWIYGEAHNSGALAEKLGSVLADETGLREAGQRARQAALNTLTVDHMAKGLIDLCSARLGLPVPRPADTSISAAAVV